MKKKIFGLIVVVLLMVPICVGAMGKEDESKTIREMIEHLYDES